MLLLYWDLFLNKSDLIILVLSDMENLEDNMITVLIAEDEPTARENLKLLLKRFPDFILVGEAENGREAIEKTLELKPDLLLTDIRMPGKSGLEVIDRLIQEKCDVESVVISAYSEFEYVKNAMKNGSSDYLLKPISPKQFAQMIKNMEIKIEDKQRKERLFLFRSMVKGEKINGTHLKKLFPFSSYHLILLRKGGLPLGQWSDQSVEIMSEIREINCVFGRDEQEALYLWPESIMDVRQFIDRQKKREKNDKTYFTIVAYENGIQVDDIPEKIKILYQVLSQTLRLGETQTIIMESYVSNCKKAEYFYFDIDQLEYFIRKNDWRLLKRTIENTVRCNAEKNISLHSLARLTNLFLEELAKRFKNTDDFVMYMNEVYYYSNSLDEFCDSLYDYLKQCYGSNQLTNCKIDTEDYFKIILDDIKKNTNHSITMREVAARYGVSKPYMSKLFKKYANCSFNEFITKYRIEKACDIMRQNPDIYIKDVAEMVGIQDQFYFSRLFRGVMGKTPSQFCQEESESK